MQVEILSNHILSMIYSFDIIPSIASLVFCEPLSPHHFFSRLEAQEQGKAIALHRLKDVRAYCRNIYQGLKFIYSLFRLSMQLLVLAVFFSTPSWAPKIGSKLLNPL